VSSLVERVAETITRYNMAAAGSRIGVAVSGGADSIALLRLLVQLAPARRYELEVIHVNHKLRGAESDADAEFVRAVAAGFGLRCVEATADARNSGGNVEAHARRLRYDCFARLMRENQLDRVAAGHTRSDQAETVLMRLLRGASPGGLRGIHPVTEAGVIRPLLEVDREEVRAWLQRQGAVWREDSSNSDRRFLRNRIRLDLLPALERGWNPALSKLLAQTARLAFEDSVYWREQMDRLLPAVAELGSGEAVLKLDALAALPAAVRRRLIREALGQVRGGLDGIEFEHDDRLLDLAESRRGEGSVSLPGALARRSFRLLRISRAGAATSEACPQFEIPFPVPGALGLPDGLRLGADLVRRSRDSRYNTEDPGIDWKKVRGSELFVRSWRPGDSYQPTGLEKVCKLKDLFEKARIPSWERAAWPMILCEGEIIWTERFGPAASWVATPETETALVISVTRQEK